MAEYLASIFATEKDKVNCSFYFKIGACRHGDRCSRIHNKPTFSQTVLILNLYCNPQNSAKSADGSHSTVSDEEMQEHYDLFFEEVFVELEDNYGEIEEMNVCDNLGDHLVGNVYIKFKFEEDAKRAVEDINNRWFNRRPMYAELSPVTDFREACCRQYEMGECTRSGFCNFMHLKPISRELRRELYGRKIRSRTKKGHKHSKKKKSRRHKNRKLSRSPITNHHSASPDQLYGENPSINDMTSADNITYSHAKVSNNSGKGNSLSKFGSRNMNSENYSYSSSRSQNEFSYPHNRSKPLSDHNKRLDARSRSPPISIGYRYGSKRSPAPRSGQSRSSRSNSRDSHSFSSRSRSRTPKVGSKSYRTRSRSTKSRSHSRSRSIVSRSRSRSRSSGSRSVKSRSRSLRSRSFHSRDRSSYSRSKSPQHPRYKGSRSTFRYSRSRSPFYQPKGDSYSKKVPLCSNISQFKPYNSLAKSTQSKSPFARLGSPSKTVVSKSQFEDTRDPLQCTSNGSQSLGTPSSTPKSSTSLQNPLKSPVSQTESDYMLNRPNSNASQSNSENTSYPDSSPSKSFLSNNYRKYPINQPTNFPQNKSLVSQRNVNNSKPPLISEVPLLSNNAPSKGPLMKTPLISRPPSVSSDNCYPFNINNEQMEFENSLPHESNMEEVNSSNVNDFVTVNNGNNEFVRNEQCNTVVCDSVPRMDQTSMMAHSANHHLANPQNTFTYTPHSLLANTNVSTAHHLAQSPAIHHSHFTSPNYQLAHHFNPLQALMPAPPLLLGGLLGGFGRGLLGTGLLNPPAGHPLTLPGFRYGNFGGASRGPPTLQQQLAKAAAAARMSRPPF